MMGTDLNLMAFIETLAPGTIYQAYEIGDGDPRYIVSGEIWGTQTWGSAYYADPEDWSEDARKRRARVWQLAIERVRILPGSIIDIDAIYIDENDPTWVVIE